MHLLSFLRGMAFGGFLVYLFAPRSGAETREMLAQRGHDLRKLLADDILDLTGEVGRDTNRVISTSEETVNGSTGQYLRSGNTRDRYKPSRFIKMPSVVAKGIFV